MPQHHHEAADKSLLIFIDRLLELGFSGSEILELAGRWTEKRTRRGFSRRLKKMGLSPKSRSNFMRGIQRHQALLVDFLTENMAVAAKPKSKSRISLERPISDTSGSKRREARALQGGYGPKRRDGREAEFSEGKLANKLQVLRTELCRVFRKVFPESPISAKRTTRYQDKEVSRLETSKTEKAFVHDGDKGKIRRYGAARLLSKAPFPRWVSKNMPSFHCAPEYLDNTKQVPPVREPYNVPVPVKRVNKREPMKGPKRVECVDPETLVQLFIAEIMKPKREQFMDPVWNSQERMNMLLEISLANSGEKLRLKEKLQSAIMEITIPEIEERETRSYGVSSSPL